MNTSTSLSKVEYHRPLHRQGGMQMAYRISATRFYTRDYYPGKPLLTIPNKMGCYHNFNPGFVSANQIAATTL